MAERRGGPAEPVVRPGRPPLLAAGLLSGAGLFDTLAGIGDLRGDPYVIFTWQGLDQLDITGWAWTHLASGALVAGAGLIVITNRRWAIAPALAATAVSIALNLALFPYFPLRALFSVVIEGVAIRLLLAHRRPRAAG